jgi:hypothetical protein
VAVGVVALALLRVAEDAVGLGRLLEPVFGVLVPLVAIGVVLERQLPVGGLDLGVGGIPRHPENLVIVASGGHFRRRSPVRPCTLPLRTIPWGSAERGHAEQQR